MLDQLKRAASKSVGTKQTVKALERGAARVVFVARDAEEHVIRRLVDLCRDLAVEIVYVDSMIELGKACGIEVGAASAALLG